jgi:glycosyltransferase involved in cell wall biosynthesis
MRSDQHGLSPAKISVLIPAYNAEAYIAESIESVLAQTWTNTEIIVVDDGSTDDTLQQAQKFAGSTVRVISQANAGASAARNKAFTLATGEYIQYLDADDLLHPDKLAAQMRCLSADADALICASAWGMFYDRPDESQLQPTVLWKTYDKPVRWLLDAWENGVWMQPSAWLTHRSLIERAGPWNEAISLHDDGEFFSRVLLVSKKIAFCADAKSFYRKGLQQSLSSIKSEKATRSHLAVCESYERSLLNTLDNFETRRACANNYQRLIYESYPEYPEIINEASRKIKALGGSNAKPHSTPFFRLFDIFFGWRLSKLIQKFVYDNGMNPASWRNRKQKRSS